MNTTTSPFNTTEGSPNEGINPSAISIVAAFFVAVLIVLSLGGNLIVCASFYTFRNLRTKCNYFIISLAVSDILVGLVAMPIWFTIQIMKKDWIHGMRNLKSMWDIMDILCGTASIMNLTAVSFDRQLAITSPFSYPQVMTSRRAIYLICFVWVYAATVAGVRLIKTDIWPFPGYLPFAATASFLFPLFIMLVMYARIYLVARYHARCIGRNYATDIKAAKTIAVVIGLFVICWLPFFVTVIAFAIPVKDADTWLHVLTVAKWLEYLNSCLNPVIYTCLNRSYRRAFRKLFLRCRSKIMRHQQGDSSWGSMADSRAPTNFTRAGESSPCGHNSAPESPRENNNGEGTSDRLLVVIRLTVV